VLSAFPVVRCLRIAGYGATICVRICYRRKHCALASPRHARWAWLCLRFYIGSNLHPKLPRPVTLALADFHCAVIYFTSAWVRFAMSKASVVIPALNEDPAWFANALQTGVPAEVIVVDKRQHRSHSRAGV